MFVHACRLLSLLTFPQIFFLFFLSFLGLSFYIFSVFTPLKLCSFLHSTFTFTSWFPFNFSIFLTVSLFILFFPYSWIAFLSHLISLFVLHIFVPLELSFSSCFLLSFFFHSLPFYSILFSLFISSSPSIFNSISFNLTFSHLIFSFFIFTIIVCIFTSLFITSSLLFLLFCHFSWYLLFRLLFSLSLFLVRFPVPFLYSPHFPITFSLLPLFNFLKNLILTCWITSWS